jgi:DNA end-binding protein Ku
MHRNVIPTTPARFPVTKTRGDLGYTAAPPTHHRARHRFEPKRMTASEHRCDARRLGQTSAHSLRLPAIGIVAAASLLIDRKNWDFTMPRASWRGFLRLSLVSCPVYQSPATTRTKPVRLHQVWRPARVEEPEDDLPDQSPDEQPETRPIAQRDGSDADTDQSSPATRITIRPHDPRTGDQIEKSEVVKGYEYSRGQFITFTPNELKSLDVESSKVIDLERFVPRGDLDPVYLDSSYYLYPDGPVAVETVRVIGAAMVEVGVVGIGRLTLSRRERAVMVEPRGTGMALFTLRAAEEVRPAQFGSTEGELDAEMVAIAGAIVKQRTSAFNPGDYRDRYQEALRELIEAKMKGLTVKPREITFPPPVIDLMAALKRSLRQQAPGSERSAPAPRKTRKTAPDRPQPALMLPVSGGRKRKPEAAAEPSTSAAKRQKRA